MSLWILVFTLQDSDIELTGPQPYDTYQECIQQGEKLDRLLTDPKVASWSCFEQGHIHHLQRGHHR